MIVREIQVKSILSRSKIFDYVVNPYTGCQYGCSYCYARFMKRFTGHDERWGEFVDVKVNAAELLQREITKKSVGGVWVSGVCDPYQPLEKRYEITRKCLEILFKNNWPVTVQTKSTLVLRDVQLLKGHSKAVVGLTVTTTDERIRRLFEPNAPSIRERIEVLGELHLVGIRTFAMIAPMLPGADGLAVVLKGKVDYVVIDRMNYHYADWVYKKYRLEKATNDSFFFQQRRQLTEAFRQQGIHVRQ